MIIIILFMMLAMMGIMVYVYGTTMDMTLYALIAKDYNAPGFIPMGFYFCMMGMIILFAVIIAMIIRIKVTGVDKRFDKVPFGKAIFDLIYRDGSSRDVYGRRLPGMSFFELPRHGIVTDVGRQPTPGSVYDFSGKKIRTALQDIGHTPNVKYAGWYPFLTEIGFNNFEEVRDVFNGYLPDLMVRVYNTLISMKQVKPEERMVQELTQMTKENVKKNNWLWKRSKK